MEKGILGGIEETRLEDVLCDFHQAIDAEGSQTIPANHTKYVKDTHLDELDDLALRHFRATQVPTLSVRGRSLPLLYSIISRLVSPPHRQSVFVLDLEDRFDATRLHCAEGDLHHVYVQRLGGGGSGSSRGARNVALKDQGSLLVAEAEKWMLYSGITRASHSRQWWGSIVVGGSGAGDLVASWKGWLRVDRQHVPEFAPGNSIEEAYDQRSARQEAVDASGWVAASPWGSFIFDDG